MQLLYVKACQVFCSTGIHMLFNPHEETSKNGARIIDSKQVYHDSKIGVS